MDISRLTISDYEEVAELWCRAGLSFEPQGRDSRAAIAWQMQSIHNCFLGAYEGSKLVGVVAVTCDTRRGWINRLAVDPDHRQRGVAQKLIAESEAILKKQGVKIFCALIDDDNVASKTLFRKSGYTEHRDIIYFSKRDSDEI